MIRRSLVVLASILLVFDICFFPASFHFASAAPDSTAPTGSVVIKSGAAYTATTGVTLSLSCSDSGSGCYQMRVSLDGTLDSELYTTFATSKSVTLPSGDGTKKVIAQFKDHAGNISPQYSDTIILDTGVPSKPSISSPLSGSTSTVSTVSLLGVSEAYSTVKVYDGSNTTPVATATTSSTGAWSATSSKLPTGSHSINAKATDRAGNTSPSSTSVNITIKSVTATASATLGKGSPNVLADISVIGTNVYTVWRDASTGSGDIYFKKSTDGGSTWGTLVNLSSNTGASSVPQIAVFGSNVYVVWQDSTTGSGDIYFKRSTDGGSTWGTLVNLSSNTGASTNPQIAVFGSNVYVVWQDSTTGSGDIYFKRSTDGGSTWGTLVNLSSNTGASSVPSISAINSNVYVSWLDITPAGSNRDVLLSRSTDGGLSFGSPVNVSGSVGGDSNSLQMSISSSYVHIVWTENADIYYSRSTDSGSTFSTPKDILAMWWDSNSPSIAVSGSNVYIVWIDTPPSSGPNVYYVRSTDNGATFGTVTDLSNNYDQILLPRVAADGTNVYVTWLEPMVITGTTNRQYDIMYQYSTDSGATFSYTAWWSDKSTNLDSKENVMAASGGNLYMLWNEYSSPVSVELRKAISPSQTVSDTVPPVITVPSSITTQTSNIAGTVVTYTVTATDNVDGSVTATCNPASGSTFPIGPTNVNCSATDSAGNTGTALFQVTVNLVDTTPPTAPAISSPAGGTTTNDNTPTFTGTAEASSTVRLYDGSSTTAFASATASGTGAWSATPSVALTNGAHSVSAKATDAAGNTSPSSTTLSITIDTLVPSAPVISSPQSGTSTSDTTPTFTGTAEASSTVRLYDGSGTIPITTVTATSTGSWSAAPGAGLSIATHSINAKATDKAGNTSPVSQAISITITNPPVTDTTPPVVSPPPSQIVEATSASGKAVTYPAATATDNVDGTLGATCSPASGSQFAIGVTTVTCSATDAAGNTGTASFTITVRDTTGPVLSLPASMTVEATSQSGRIVTFTATATDAVDGARPVTCSPASGSTFAIGITTVNCSSTDSRGNSRTGSFTITVRDSTAPTVSITSPSSGSTVNGMLNIGASASDNTVISNLKLYVDGVYKTMDSSAPYSFSVDTSAYVNGQHNILVIGTDGSNNQGNSQTVTVQVQNVQTADTIAPTVSITGPTDGSTVSGFSARITISATDASGIAKVEVYIDGALQSTLTGTGPTFTYDWSIKKVANGDHTIVVKAFDTYGNNASDSATVTKVRR